MSQNSGPFLVSSHGHPSFNPRQSSLPSKRTNNGTMSMSTSPNTSINVSSLMRPSNSIGPIKPGTVGIPPMDKSNSMPYPSRYTRKMWPMTRSIHDKPIRGHDDHETPYLRPSLPAPDAVSGSSFAIESSADDDEGDDIYFSSRHMAAARFQRNQRLLCEIFNEVCIPDLRSNVNVDRILTLRRQVNALKTHRETFEKDLNDLEEKHVEKKRKFLEINEKFYSEYADASSTTLSEEKIKEILQKYEAMEKLQKEKQLILQQQQHHQQAVATPPLTLPLPSMVVVSQSTIPPVIKTEAVPIVEAVQQQTSPSSSSTQIQLPLSQPITAQLPPSQPVPSQIPPSQPIPTQVPPSQSVQTQLPPSHSAHLQPPPSAMTHVPPSQQQQQPAPTSQGYPMMHSGGGYPPVSGYGHPQHGQYRPPMNQRPTQYPPNVQWQQQQQWQTNAYDPRYYNSYPPNVQWSQQQQQQWPPNQSQQQPQMRGPSQQQQSQMYANGVHYGYPSNTGGWTTTPHPSQQYGYPQNPSYDPSVVPTQPPQQYYSSPQMHPQGYDYGPPPPPPPSQQQMPPPPPSSMNRE